MIYFCQGCGAVLEHRVKYCPHCGTKQYYEDKCSYCGADYKEGDTDCPDVVLSLNMMRIKPVVARTAAIILIWTADSLT
jgi:methionyl-tRNA synthetase